MDNIWIARDEDFSLWIHFEKPEKSEDEKFGCGCWLSEGGIIEVPPHLFPEVKWEDEEPRELTLK